MNHRHLKLLISSCMLLIGLICLAVGGIQAIVSGRFDTVFGQASGAIAVTDWLILAFGGATFFTGVVLLVATDSGGSRGN